MSDTAPTATLDPKKIDEIFSTIDQCQLPGAAVAVAIGGVPVYRKGFGLANLELPVALSPSMRMRIGSTTKHFTSLAYMLLCEEGRAGIDDEIGKYIPELHEISRHVTMRQLMGHTSGIRDVFSVTMYFHGTGRLVTDKQLLAYYETIDDVDFQPGTHWSYNNGGYMLLSTAIERITGEPLEDVLRKRIFEPVGMYDTLLRRWDSDFTPNSATLHMVNRQGRYSRDYMGMEISGAGGMVSSMDDMLRWLKHMDAPFVGSVETWKTMTAPHRLTSGVSTGYGLGLMSIPYRGIETLSHGGGVMGGNSQTIKVPSAKLDISIAVNRADLNAADLAFKIIDACVEGLDPEPEEGAAEKRSAVYVSPGSGRVVELSVKKDVQLLSYDGSPALPVKADASGLLQLPEQMRFMQTSFRPGDGFGVFAEFGAEDVVAEAAPDREGKLGARVGDYGADTVGVVAEVSDGEQGARLAFKGRYGNAEYELKPLTETVWRASWLGPFPGLTAIVTFDPDGQGFDFTVTRMKHMRFVRA